MENKKWFQLLGSFLHQHLLTIGMFIFFTVVFFTIAALYQLEMEAIFYATGLCIAGVLVLCAIRFSAYCKDHQQRQEFLKQIEFIYDRLPPAKNLVETDYHQILRILGDINRQHLTSWQKERQESLDYYTTWVHQIKIPIAVMKMNLQSKDTSENRALLAELFRIEQYVNMVLSYIRLGSNQTDFVIQEYDLDGIIRQAIRHYAPQFIQHRLRLIYEPVHINVLTDEKWLLFILEQLLSNAIKYTPKGTITISVSSEQILSISDTGIGIAPEDIPRIFEKGFTGYNGRSDKKATGLGLYLCNQTAHKLGIRLTAASTPGKGSTFSLDLKKTNVVID